MKINSRDELLRIADRYNVSRYTDGRIDKIDVFKNNKKIHTTQAVYSTTNNLSRLTDIQGFLFPEIWNSTETPELNWYDRNVSSVLTCSFAADITPVGISNAWTYTVPNNRKAFVEVARVSLLQTVASTGTAPATTSIFMILYPKGATSFTESILEAACIAPTAVGFQITEAIGQSLTLDSGEIISCGYINAADDGTCRLKGVAKITEFDA